VSRAVQYATHSDGALTFGAPLFAGGAVGAILGLRSWGRLAPAARALLVVAIGWFVAGFVPLTIVPYAPNRYVLPSLPPLALMIGIGLQTVFSWESSKRRAFRAVQIVAITIAVCAPGLLSYALWMARAPTTLPAIQAQVAAAVPGDATVAGGLAPLLAMRTTGPVLFSLFGINQGDLYAEKGVRWVVVGRQAPTWAARHPDAWANRRLILSTTWGGNRVELYRLP